MTERQPVSIEDLAPISLMATGDAHIVGWFSQGDTPPTPDASPVVSGTMPPPTTYRRPDGAFDTLGDDVSHDWPNPRWASIPGGNGIWFEVPDTAFETQWGDAGWHLRPRTRWGLFAARIAEGRAMRYPWPAVLAFAWRYR
jgi:hypothetical protein